MEYDVRLEQLDSRPLAVVRRRARLQELAKVVPDACGLVWSVVRAQKITGAGRHVALYWNDQIDLEVGVELEAPFAGHGEVVGSATPAGAVATATHFGPCDGLHEVHQAVRQWCARHGYQLAGPNWEIYGHWRDEWNTDPARIRTDVFYLLKTDRPSAGSSDTEDEIRDAWPQRLARFFDPLGKTLARVRPRRPQEQLGQGGLASRSCRGIDDRRSGAEAMPLCFSVFRTFEARRRARYCVPPGWHAIACPTRIPPRGTLLRKRL